MGSVTQAPSPALRPDAGQRCVPWHSLPEGLPRPWPRRNPLTHFHAVPGDVPRSQPCPEGPQEVSPPRGPPTPHTDSNDGLWLWVLGGAASSHLGCPGQKIGCSEGPSCSPHSHREAGPAARLWRTAGLTSLRGHRTHTGPRPPAQLQAGLGRSPRSLRAQQPVQSSKSTIREWMPGIRGPPTRTGPRRWAGSPKASGPQTSPSSPNSLRSFLPGTALQQAGSGHRRTPSPPPTALPAPPHGLGLPEPAVLPADTVQQWPPARYVRVLILEPGSDLVWEKGLCRCH